MKARIVADGQFRLRASEEFQTRLREARESIRARHAAEFAKAGFFARLVLRWNMAAEFRQERKRIEPSPYSLYIRSTLSSGSVDAATQGKPDVRAQAQPGAKREPVL